jgi:hypothetical protein
MFPWVPGCWGFWVVVFKYCVNSFLVLLIVRFELSLEVARQALYHLNHTPSPYVFVFINSEMPTKTPQLVHKND